MTPDSAEALLAALLELERHVGGGRRGRRASRARGTAAATAGTSRRGCSHWC